MGRGAAPKEWRLEVQTSYVWIVAVNYNYTVYADDCWCGFGQNRTTPNQVVRAGPANESLALP